uniref:CSON003664 protein n=1 Tax=Culicoides sonorensis TaxID=179676 RepID=A0A336K1Z5_CULSO
MKINETSSNIDIIYKSKKLQRKFILKDKKGMAVKTQIILLIHVLCSLLHLTLAAKKGISSLSLQIDPAWVRRGESVQLFCNYDMESNPLYSVKWYRGTLEFYRYSPFENPPAKIFPYTGIKVDLSVSNATHVILRNIGFSMSGNFSCEVTADAPSFYTATATSTLTVVDLPNNPPVLWTAHKKYSAGDVLFANCSTAPSRPPATLSFKLNDFPVGNTETELQPTKDGLQWASRSLFMQLLPSHFHQGMLLLKCKAEIGQVYSDSTEIQLGASRRDPIPERVHAAYPGTGSSLFWSNSLLALMND